MNKEKHAFIVAIARRLSVGAALVENEVAYRAAKTGDIEPDGYVLVRIHWGELTDKFEYMTGKIPVRATGGGVYYVPDPDEQTWLAELEDAGIIALDSDDHGEEWEIRMPSRYLMERGCA